LLDNENYWNNSPIYEYNVMHCNLLNIRGDDDKESVSNRRVNLIKSETPLDYEYTL
jgi:hypothetical protein